MKITIKIYLLFCFCLVATALAQTPSPNANITVEARQEERAKAKHILITYYGALLAKKKIRRNREEAATLAEEIEQKLQQGEKFASLARQYGDDSTAARGGKLGSFSRGTMDKEFEDVVFQLQPDEYTIVETAFGFHVVQRQPLIEVNLIHIVTQWKGAFRAKDNNKKTKKQAFLKIKQARERLLQGTPAQQVARSFSDGAYGPRGGHVGWFEKGELSPSLDKPAFNLEIGEISTIIENGAGYHLLIRVY